MYEGLIALSMAGKSWQIPRTPLKNNGDAAQCINYVSVPFAMMMILLLVTHVYFLMRLAMNE